MKPSLQTSEVFILYIRVNQKIKREVIRKHPELNLEKHTQLNTCDHTQTQKWEDKVKNSTLFFRVYRALSRAPYLRHCRNQLWTVQSRRYQQFGLWRNLKIRTQTFRHTNSHTSTVTQWLLRLTYINNILLDQLLLLKIYYLWTEENKMKIWSIERS